MWYYPQTKAHTHINRFQVFKTFYLRNRWLQLCLPSSLTGSLQVAVRYSSVRGYWNHCIVCIVNLTIFLNFQMFANTICKLPYTKPLQTVIQWLKPQSILPFYNIIVLFSPIDIQGRTSCSASVCWSGEQVWLSVTESIISQRWISSIELEGKRGVVVWHPPLRVTVIVESGYVSWLWRPLTLTKTPTLWRII